MSNLKSNNSKMIALTLWIILGLNVIFVWSEFLPFLATELISWINEGLSLIRVQLTIIELIAVGTLFVDLVVRYDNIKLNLRALHVISVGICVCGFIFKAFIHFLHSAYLS